MDMRLAPSGEPVTEIMNVRTFWSCDSGSTSGSEAVEIDTDGIGTGAEGIGTGAEGIGTGAEGIDADAALKHWCDFPPTHEQPRRVRPAAPQQLQDMLSQSCAK